MCHNADVAGAYWLGTAHEKDFHSRICLGLVDVSGYDRVFAVDYRLVVQQPFPAALIDALVAYQHLLDVEGYRPDQITICGDSAGGVRRVTSCLADSQNLALALARLLRDTSTLPLPGALLLLSPWCVWSLRRDLTPAGVIRPSPVRARGRRSR